jgi:hypothetical protein
MCIRTPNTSLITPPTVQKDDLDALSPVAVFTSDDALQSCGASSEDGDTVPPDLPTSETPLPSEMNRESKSPSEAGPAANFCLPLLNLDTPAGPRGSCEPEGLGLASEEDSAIDAPLFAIAGDPPFPVTFPRSVGLLSDWCKTARCHISCSGGHKGSTSF